MSTRGTYKIDGNLCYNHHDNYPSGAAFHFLNSLQKTNSASFFSFVRGMERLEPATNIFDGPAEYHYNIADGYVKCYAINIETDNLTLISHGPIAEWVTDQLKNEKERYKRMGKEFFDEGEDDRDITIVHSKRGYYTLRQVEEGAKVLFEQGITAFAQGWTGNASSHFADAFKAFKTCGIGQAEREIYLRDYSPAFAKSYGHSDTTLFDSYATI